MQRIYISIGGKMVEQLEKGLTEANVEAGDIDMAILSLGHVIEFEE